jgi:hypothetical protein
MKSCLINFKKDLASQSVNLSSPHEEGSMNHENLQ